jgi:hypothetical protein
MGLMRVTLVLSMFTLLFLSGAAESNSHKPQEALPEPEHIPKDARDRIRSRMSRHAAEMSSLLRAIAVLDRPAILASARYLADHEILSAQSGPANDTCRPMLPGAFFVEEIAFSTIARQVVMATEHGNDDGIADRFAALARTCVACHSSYLHGRPGS